MDPSDEICKALIIWLQTLVPERTKNVMEISDGVAILQALIQMCPIHFYKLEGKIKSDVDSIWRIKLTNLKKILTTVLEYYNDVLNFQISPVGLPDLLKLCEKDDLIELGKLLRLLLGCAVHCDQKQEYITKIMAMEESVQRCIMQAIQELEKLIDGVGKSGLSLLSLDTSESRLTKLMNELDVANEAKETLAQQCHHLESQVQSLQEEKQTLLSENQVLATQIRETEHNDGPRGLEVRKQTDLYREEIFKLESIRDDYSAKVRHQEKQIQGLQDRIAELQHAAEVNSRLKDEVDALSESAEKVKALEMAVASYKKKLDDHLDIKKQIKILEDKNIEYIQQNMKYEEELKKHNIWKNSSDLYKSQVTELQTKLDEETRQLDKALFQNKSFESKLEALQSEKERLDRDCVALREENEELRLNGNRRQESGAAMSQELAPTEIKERLRFLEKENKALRTTSQEVESKQLHLDDALTRLNKLAEQNRLSNQRILELESQLESFKGESGDESIKEYKQKVQQLQESLASKEQELQVMQVKHTKYMEKAREVSQSFDKDVKSNGSIESIRHQSNMNMKDEEERLISTAFYRLSMQLQRDTVDERLALLSAGQGQSFLSRQRQPVPRKPVTPFKSK